MNRQQKRALAALRRGRSGRLLDREQRREQRILALADRWLDKVDDMKYVEALEDENAALQELQAEHVADLNRIVEIVHQPLELDSRAREVIRLEQKVSGLESQRLDLRELPSDLPTTISLVEELYRDRIVFTPAAHRSARCAQCQDPRVAWRLLRSMATVLHDLHYGDAGDIERLFRDQTGFEVALHESGVTKKSRHLRRQRLFEFEGETYDMSAHVKYGTRPPKLIRVHYAFDDLHGLIIVGHCGDHLPTASFR